MLSIEHNIRWFHWRCELHLGIVRVLFGVHKGREGAYFKLAKPLWMH